MSEKITFKLPEHSVAVILGGSVGLASVVYFNGKLKEYKERRRLNNLRANKQKERAEQFDSLEKKYPFGPESASIVSLPFESLVSKLQKRELTAEKVLEAFIAKAIAVTREFNCVTEFVPQCFEWAKSLDSLSSTKGPLHGIPICIKDDHDIEGMDTTMGYSIYIDKPKSESAVIVKILQDAGAIPFCKTNLPQTIYSFGSENPIYGTTLNPRNKKLNPGGSSAGTGCLVGAGGALFGLGSDLGGSLRVPAHFCGISTLRSTIGRLSGRGILQCLEDNAGYTGVTGIMASQAKTLSAVYKVAVTDAAQNQYDPLTVPIAWNAQMFESKKPLRIGYYTSLPVFPSIGDTPDTVLKAKAALEALGHILVPFEVPDPKRILHVFITLASADGGNLIYRKLKHDEISPAAKKFIPGRSLSSYICLKLLSFFGARNNPSFSAESSEVLWKYLYEQRQIKYEFMDKMKDQNLDLILAPTFPYPATRMEDSEELLDGLCGGLYTSLYNFLDFPAGVTPFGTETCYNMDSYDDQGDYHFKLAKEGAKCAKGMPIGVQVIGKPFKEEMVLRVLTELEEYKLKK